MAVNDIELKSFKGKVVGSSPIDIDWLTLFIVKVVETDEAIKLLSAGKLALIDTKPALCKVIIFPVTDAINGLLEL